MRPLQICTVLLHRGFGVELQRCFPYSEVDHSDAPGNGRSGVRKAPVGQGGSRGRVVGDIQPPSMPQSNMSEMARSGRLCSGTWSPTAQQRGRTV